VGLGRLALFQPARKPAKFDIQVGLSDIDYAAEIADEGSPPTEPQACQKRLDEAKGTPRARRGRSAPLRHSHALGLVPMEDAERPHDKEAVPLGLSVVMRAGAVNRGKVVDPAGMFAFPHGASSA